MKRKILVLLLTLTVVLNFASLIEE
ncbi:MAG: hypothetical protein PWQ77_2009, partial [Kosmotogales bacterium]|nr:hypothetical protein [Kosmotogales bacterium]